jgi:hypothetical protein
MMLFGAGVDHLHHDLHHFLVFVQILARQHLERRGVSRRTERFGVWTRAEKTKLKYKPPKE